MFFYDKKITISIGASRKSKNWQRQEMNYSDFVNRVSKPVRSTESLKDYLGMPKSKQDTLKDVGGFVGGALVGRRRKANLVTFRDLITLDFDNIPAGATNDVVKQVQLLGCAYVIYSTRKHTGYRPRLRIIIPTDRSMTVDEYEPVARKLAELIGIEMADPTTFEASRLMYWPSCSADSEFVFKYEDKPFLAVDGTLALYEDWRVIETWPRVAGEDVAQRQQTTKQQDPTAKQGLIGAFCRTYDIYLAMNTFIPQAYVGTEKTGRFTYLAGSTTGGAVVYQNGLFLYSHHATDPCGGKLVNAWDLVRLHKFSHLDDEADEGTPVTSLPSTVAMRELAREDQAVVARLNTERQDAASGFFEAIGQESATDETEENWRRLLTYDTKGAVEKTIANVVTILNFDPQFKGRLYLDEFANRGMVMLPLPWEDGEGARLWSDQDDAQLALRLEKEHGITGRDKIETAIKVVGFNNRRNDVKEYIQSCDWDGVTRIETMLRDYLGAEQNVYAGEIMKKALVAAIARAFSSKGVKFDYMVVFKGPQGIGKSTLLSKLGGPWFSDSLYSFEGKEAAELIQGTLINEVGELSAMTKTETETVKQFLSKTHDIYREAYGKRTNKYPRRCVFFGSTNSEEFLKDATGNRRFWPIRVGEQPKRLDVFEDLDDQEVAQIWGEAYYYYLVGEQLFLSPEAEAIAEKMQDDFREKDPKEGAIVAYLEKKIPSNWYDLNVSQQRSFYNDTFKGADDEALVERDKVCVAEIWEVCFGGDLKYLRRRESNEIVAILTGLRGWKRNKSRRRYGTYGTQRGFERSKVINIDMLKKETDSKNEARGVNQ